MERKYIVRSLTAMPYQVVMIYGDLEIVVYSSTNLDKCIAVSHMLEE